MVKEVSLAALDSRNRRRAGESLLERALRMREERGVEVGPSSSLDTGKEWHVSSQLRRGPHAIDRIPTASSPGTSWMQKGMSALRLPWLDWG